MNDAAVWSSYWSQGHLNSFGDTSKQNYKGLIKDTWTTYLNKVKKGDTVLDLCTGNASLLRLAADEVSDFSMIKFIGVDYATIDKSDDFFEKPNIQLISNQSVEVLPFDNMSVAFICSNFGVEYSDINKTSQEVMRVLTKGGFCQYICHDKASKLIKDNEHRLLFLKQLLMPSGAIDSLLNLVLLLEKNIKNDKSEQYRNKLNSALSSLLELNKALLLETQVLDFLKFVLNPKNCNKVNEVIKYKDEMNAYLKRLYFMIDAALTESQINELVEIIINNGGEILENRQLIENYEVIGRKIYFMKN